jgi:hypothetical protein
MTNEENKKLMEKWSTLLDSQESKVKWNPKSTNGLINNNNDTLENSFGDFIFPMVRISAQTIGMNLVNVQPMTMEPSDKVKNEVKSINRERKIESIIDDREFKEMKFEDHPDYKGYPEGKIFYMDYKYGVTSSNP